MMFRPCIDLHQGKVKQIIGSSLSENEPDTLVTNFVSEKPPAWYATLYKSDNLRGGHIIKLGDGNDDAATEALSAWPGGLQLGGGINDANAEMWLEKGAEKLIVTSHVFKKGEINESNLKRLSSLIGSERLVLDLSCRRREGQYFIATERWQNLTNVAITKETLDYFAGFSGEFLIHAVDVEGKANGIEQDLVKLLASWGKIPITYAGGIRHEDDIKTIAEIGKRRIDFTIGSALDIFGGSGFRYRRLVEKIQRNEI